MPLGKKSPTSTGAVFVITTQALELLQENPCGYGALVSEATIYSYVENNPLALTDPTGYEPWGRNSDGNTQYSDTGNGTIGNTYTGDTYSYSPGVGAGRPGSAVSASDVAGTAGGGASPIATYSSNTGAWSVTSFGQTLAANNQYNFQIQLAVLAAGQNQPWSSWGGPSLSWTVSHLDAHLWGAFKGGLAQFASAIGLRPGAVMSGIAGYFSKGATQALSVEGKALLTANPVGSALKADPAHRAATFMREEAATNGTNFAITGGDGVTRTLTQVPGELNGVAGRYEYIVDSLNNLTHQMFVRGGSINGVPIKP